MQIMTNATFNGLAVWHARHNGPYGYAVCYQSKDMAPFTPIKFK